MVIALPSTGLDGPALTLTSDQVCGKDKLMHLSSLPVTNMGDNPLSPVCGTFGSLLGLYPVPIRDSILKTPLFWYMNGDMVLSVGSTPHKSSVDNKITGWLGVSEPKETEYDQEIIFPAFSNEAADTSVFDLLHMALPLSFNHGLSVGYATSGKITEEKMIEAWNVFAGAGENLHKWIVTPFFHRWAELMADSGKKLALCWGQSGTYDTEP
jgi:hypothetical protein